MKITSLLFAGLLAVLPGLAGATCLVDHARMPCETGKVWDEASKSCLQTSS